MATPLSESLFWLAVLIVGIAQFQILRSTRRGMTHGPIRSGSLLEWGFAVLPALALVVVLAFTWRAMHHGTVRFESQSPAAGARS